MQKHTKHGLPLALAGAFLLGLSACAAQQAPQPVVITLMHGWGGSRADHLAMSQIYADFAAENPDIQLQYDASPDITVVIDKANDMLAADTMPDIISTNGNSGFVDGAKKKNLALDLAPYLAADPEFAANISDGVLQAWTNADGTLYTIPDVQEVIGYWYNEDLFRQAGITDTGTPDGAVTPPTTWDDFWAACDALAAIEGQTGAAPMRMQKDQLRILLGARLAAQDGPSRQFMQNKAAACDAAEVRAAAADMQRAIAYSNAEPLSAADARQLFFEGKSAIYWNGVWANTELTQTTTAQHIRYACFPSNTGGAVSYVSPQSGYVLGNTGSQEQIDACVRFLKYIVSEDVQKRIVTETGQVPGNPKITTDWISSEAPILGKAVETCYQADTQILSLYILLSDRQVSELDRCVEQMLQGNDVTDRLLTILSGSTSIA